jgi:hypothetical protein
VFCGRNFCVKCFDYKERNNINFHNELFSNENETEILDIKKTNNNRQKIIKCYYCIENFKEELDEEFDLNDYIKKIQKISINNNDCILLKKCYKCLCQLDEKKSSGLLKLCGICKCYSCNKDECKFKYCFVCGLSICFYCSLINLCTSKNKIKKESKQIKLKFDKEFDYKKQAKDLIICLKCANILFDKY